jgi:hypothetical protein
MTTTSPQTAPPANDVEFSKHGLTKEIAIEVKNGRTYYRGIPVSDMHAYPTELAARLIGINGTTLRRRIAQGKIRRNSDKLISREELYRYACGSTEAKKQRKAR